MSVLKIKSQDLFDVSEEIENHLLFIKKALHGGVTFTLAEIERFFIDTINSSTGEIEIIELLVQKNRYPKDNEDGRRKIEQLQAELRQTLKPVKLSLLEHGASMFHEFEEERFFRAAIICKETQLIQLLDRSGCSLKGSEYFLHKAIQNGNIDLVRSLLNLEYPASTLAFGRRPVHEAAARRSAEILKLLVEHGADAHEPDEDGLSVVHHAVRTGTVDDSKELLDVLTSYGISVDVREESTGRTALQIAIGRRNKELAQYLVLDKTASVSVCDNRGNSILHSFLADLQFSFVGQGGSELRNKYDAMKVKEIKSESLLLWILSQGADPLHENAEKETPFHIVCRNHLLTTLRVFIGHLRNLEIVKNGNKVLQHLLFAVYNMYKFDFPQSEILSTVNVVKQLLVHGLVVDWGDDKFKPFHFALADLRCRFVIEALLPRFTAADVLEGGSTVLHLLLNTRHGVNLQSISDYVKLAKRLISKGADVNARDPQLMTALLYAAKYKYKRVLDLLLHHKACVRATDSHGRNALHVLSEQVGVGAHRREPEMVGALASHGCPVNALSSSGFSPVHYAACAGRGDIVAALLSCGAAAEYRGTSVEQPLILAAQSGCPEAVRVLLEAGARVNERDRSGRTALHHAAGHWSRDRVLPVLLSRAADTEVRDREHRRTPLHEAFRSRNRTAIEFLVKHGADLNAVDGSGATPVVYCEGAVSQWLVCHLVKARAAGLRVSPDYDRVVDSDNRYRFLVDTCGRELPSLGSVRGSCLSVLQFLRMDVEEAYAYYDREDFKKLLFSQCTRVEFQRYAALLRSKYYRLLAVRKVVEPAKEAFSRTVSSRLPENCVEKILLHMGTSHVLDFLRDYQENNEAKSSGNNWAGKPLEKDESARTKGNLRNSRKRILTMDD